MKIATWNVNSLKVRLSHVINWLKTHEVDFLLIQEVKGLDETIFENFEKIGYKSYHLLQKGYNGVVILTKHNCEVVNKGIPNFSDPQARFIEIKYQDIFIINAYMPNGNPYPSEKYDYKLDWNNEFYKYIKNKINSNDKIIIGGDFNIAPKDKDVYSTRDLSKDSLTQKEVRDFYFSLINLGFTDVIEHKYKNNQIFSWWDYRGGSFDKNKGLRIDHILISPFLADYLQDAFIDKTPRSLDNPSDHAPVICNLENI